MADAELPSSGALLERLWRQYLEGWQKDFPGVTTPSMRSMSHQRLLADAQALARWTNARMHAAGRPQWRIPLRRIPEVCLVLGASAEQTDELIAARLAEMHGSEQGQDVAVVIQWLHPLLAQLTSRPALDEEQKTVVRAYDAVRNAAPFGDVRTTLEMDEAQLRSALLPCLYAAVNAYQAELAGQQLSAREQRRQRAKRSRVERLTRASAQAAARKPPTVQETHALIRRARAQLRGRQDEQDAGAEAGREINST